MYFISSTQRLAIKTTDHEYTFQSYIPKYKILQIGVNIGLSLSCLVGVQIAHEYYSLFIG